MKVSICIPTYNRPQLLLEAINSCLDQSSLPFEILIGDDSTNDETSNVINKLINEDTKGVNIKYIKNVPSLRQTKNVDMLIKSVEGDKLILLHDDDLLMPDAVKLMSECFKNNDIDACYGKQYFMSEDGIIDYNASEEGSSFYFKSPEFAGQKLNSIDVVMSHQFPNDGFMLDSLFAKQIGYAEEQASDACDFIFAFKLGKAGCKFYFLDQYTAIYRNTGVSISSQGGDASFVICQSVWNYPYNAVDRDYKSLLLQRHIRQAIAQASYLKKKKDGYRMYFSKYHLPYIFSLGGAKRFFSLLFK